MRIRFNKPQVSDCWELGFAFVKGYNGDELSQPHTFSIGLIITSIDILWGCE